MAGYERIGYEINATGGVSLGLTKEADVALLAACMDVLAAEPEHQTIIDITTKALADEAEFMIRHAAEIADLDIDWEAFDKEHGINGKG